MTDDTALLSTKDLAGVTRYHTDPECQNLPPETREWPIEKAEQRGLTHCRYCDPDYEVENEGHSRSLRSMIEDDETDLEVSL